jgi:uncharacterized protein YjbI with pentapeptide repeats
MPRAVVTVLVIVTALVAGGMVATLWSITGEVGGTDLVSARYEAVRIGLSIALGGGGIIALYLTWRRQQSTEDTLAHQEHVALINEKDAIERRITELYTRAADQLGSDKAPVRLAGLYALERLADDYKSQRQTIVNLLCAYLRMPFSMGSRPEYPTTAVGPTRTWPEEVRDDVREYEDRLEKYRINIQEREVRVAVQRILTGHCCVGNVPVCDDRFWSNLQIDLTGATLDSPDFRGCIVDRLDLASARVVGVAYFDEARINSADFSGAHFEQKALFRNAAFHDRVLFAEVTFCRAALFNDAIFESFVSFSNMEVQEMASFHHVEFGKNATFEMSKFAGRAAYSDCEFSGLARFDGATFAQEITFSGAHFAGGYSFRGVGFDGSRPDTRGAVFEGQVPRELQI